MYLKVYNWVNDSRPEVDTREPWPKLSPEQNRELSQASAMMIEAADQGHMKAQGHCGDMYGSETKKIIHTQHMHPAFVSHDSATSYLSLFHTNERCRSRNHGK